MVVLWLPPCILDRIKRSEPNVCWWDPSKNVKFVYFIAVVGHHVPCFIIIYCYISVLYLTRKRLVRPRMNPKAHRRHVSATAEATTHSNVQCDTDSTSRSAYAAGSVNASLLKSPKNVANHRVRQTQIAEDGSSREKKIFVTLNYILFTYLLCWLPFHIIFDISFIAPELVPAWVYSFGFWLTYLNSTLNPIVYACSNKEFRKAFKRVVSCKCRH